MGIQVVCDDCGAEFRAKDEHAGRKVSCPECRQPIRIPDPDSPRRSPSRSRPKTPARGRSAGRMPGWAWGAIGGGGVAIVALIVVLLTRGGGSEATPPANQVAAQPTGVVPADPTAGGMPTPTAVPSAAPMNPAAAMAATTNPMPPVQPTVANVSSTLPTTPGVGTTASLPGTQPVAAALGAAPVTTAARETPYANLADLIQAIEPSVVRITIHMPGGGVGAGSGYVVDSEGTIVTNRHVIEGAARCTGRFSSDKIEHAILGTYYVDEKRDIAVVKIDAPREKLKPLTLAKELPRKGEALVAFGAPLGLDFTTTQGIVSAVREAAELASLGIVDYEGTWLQHSVPISPGNSGGPLVNMKGEVVGMNTMTITIGQNLNFAISAKDVADGIAKKSPTMTPMQARAVPERRSRPRQPTPPKDIVGTDQAKEFLGQIKTMDIIMVRAGFDPTQRITASVRSDFEKALDIAKIRVTSPGQAFMLVAMELEEGAGTKASQQLTISSICFIRDDGGQVFKIWDEKEKVGTVADQLFFRGEMPKTLRANIGKYFTKFSGAVNRSRLDADKAKKAAAGSAK